MYAQLQRCTARSSEHGASQGEPKFLAWITHPCTCCDSEAPTNIHLSVYEELHRVKYQCSVLWLVWLGSNDLRLSMMPHEKEKRKATGGLWCS